MFSETTCDCGKTITHPQGVTACCIFWAEAIIGPYFAENETDQATTVTNAR